MKPSPDQINKFHEYFSLHLEQVQIFGYKIMNHPKIHSIKLESLLCQHNMKKMNIPEKFGHVWIFWENFCKKEGKEFSYPKEIVPLVKSTIYKHKIRSCHHPEHFTDIEYMEPEHIGVMVANWLSHAIYNGKEWESYLEEKIDTYDFTEDQIGLIWSFFKLMNLRKETIPWHNRMQ